MKRADEAPLLHIRNWNGRFETHRTRELRTMTYIVESTDLGDTYAAILDHPEGTAHFGVMMALHIVASKGVPRGYLRKDDQTPHTCESLSRVLRMPERIVKEAIARLLEIGELEDAREPKKHRTKSATSAKAEKTVEISFPQVPIESTAPRRDIGRTDGRTNNTRESDPFRYHELAARMYEKHPKKERRILAEQALYEALSTAADRPALAMRIEASHAAWVPSWEKREVKFVPRA